MKIKKVNTDYILFDNGFKLISHHDTDCCEEHYADFNALIGTGYENVEFPTRLFNLISPNSTVIINEYNDNPIFNGTSFFNLVDVLGNKYPIPIYNSNNGYYDNTVTLILYKNVSYKEILIIQ